MQQVKIHKTRLLNKLEENLAKHKKEYDRAHYAWKKKVHIALANAFENAKNDVEYKVHFNLPEPISYEKHYIREIEMVEMSVDDEITLTQGEFNTLVMDEWSWKNSFVATTSQY